MKEKSLHDHLGWCRENIWQKSVPLDDRNTRHSHWRHDWKGGCGADTLLLRNIYLETHGVLRAPQVCTAAPVEIMSTCYRHVYITCRQALGQFSAETHLPPEVNVRGGRMDRGACSRQRWADLDLENEYRTAMRVLVGVEPASCSRAKVREPSSPAPLAAGGGPPPRRGPWGALGSDVIQELALG